MHKSINTAQNYSYIQLFTLEKILLIFYISYNLQYLVSFNVYFYYAYFYLLYLVIQMYTAVSLINN